jgi:hypothetical protein
MKYGINVIVLGTTILVYRISPEMYSRPATQDVSSLFKESEGSLPYQQQPATGTSPVPDRLELNFQSILISDFHVRLGNAGSQH